MTSMSVCARIRRILHVDKVGHAGTLDPMAEGVLPVALGRACKSVDEAGQAGKTYEAGMLLGTVTDTLDTTGTVMKQYDGELPSEHTIREAVMSFLGGYEQLTPMYSARHVDGKRLYDLARAGKEIKRDSKWIDIDAIELISIDGPHVKFRVTCSKGTYVRSICNDIGEKLGCGACMESLVRTDVGSFSIEDALTLSDIERLKKQEAIDSVLRVITPTVVAIGKFDGTHLGHQALLRELRKTSEKLRLRSLVLIISFGEKSVEEIEERKNRILSLGIDYVIELKLTDEIRQMSATEFLHLLIEKYSMRHLIGGIDISFGYRKQGNAEFLYEHAKEFGIGYTLIDKITIPDPTSGQIEQVVSSTYLKEMLHQGNMEAVSRIMGKGFTLRGKTVPGRRIGSEILHIPTANINVSESMELPPYGVYVVKVSIPQPDDRRNRNDLTAPKGKNDRIGYGIANLGIKPSIDEGQNPISLETHIFDLTDFDKVDLYGKQIYVELLHFLRPEQRFDSMEELRKQITETDIPAAREYLKKR